MTGIQTLCGNCIFHKRSPDAQSGLCVRFPPSGHVIRITLDEQQVIARREGVVGGYGAPVKAVTVWPETNNEAVCGEWRPDQETQKKAMMQAAFAPGAIMPGSGGKQ